jgi:hypothetical protein
MYNKENYLVDLGEIQSVSNVVYTLSYEAKQTVVSDPELEIRKNLVKDVISQLENLNFDVETLGKIKKELLNADLQNEYTSIDSIVDLVTDLFLQHSDSIFSYDADVSDSKERIEITKEWDPA